MFLIGFYSVFALLLDMFDGLILFVLLITCVFTISLLSEKIKKYIKTLKDKDSSKGLLHNKNVIVTGGSSGIGKCVAVLAARQGAHVTIIARNLEKMQLARDEILEACRDRTAQRIECVPLDVSGDYEHTKKAFDEMERSQGPCYMLVNCAGTAVCGKIEDTTDFTMRHLVNLNLMGTYNCIRAVVPSMKRAKEGKIVLVGSQATLLGIFGYSAYCSTKFALRGLAESLVMELSPYNISVTLSMPPDTDTPGFAVEEETKPLETKLISQSAALVTPEAVANKIMEDSLDGKFFSIIGFESFILTTLCSGMSPYSSLSELILQSLLMGPLRIVSAFYLDSFRKIVTRCMAEREKHKKSE